MPKPPKFEGGGLSEGEGKFQSTHERVTEEALSDAPEESEFVSPKEARAIMGWRQFFGDFTINSAFGFHPSATHSETGHLVPFSKKELERAKELGQYLIYQVDKLPGDLTLLNAMDFTKRKLLPLTIENVYKEYKPNYRQIGWRVDRKEFKKQDFWQKETPRPGWRLVTPAGIPGAAGKDYIGQLQALVSYVEDEVYKGQPVPAVYQTAIEAFNQFAKEYSALRNSGESTLSFFGKLSEFLLFSPFIERPVEVIYRLILMREQQSGTRAGLENQYIWTGTLCQSGSIPSAIQVGFANPEVQVFYRSVFDIMLKQGICFSRGTDPAP